MRDDQSACYIKARTTDLTLNLGPVLFLRHTPVAVGEPSGGADRLVQSWADHRVGLAHSDPLAHSTELAWLTVENREVCCGRGTECVL